MSGVERGGRRKEGKMGREKWRGRGKKGRQRGEGGRGEEGEMEGGGGRKTIWREGRGREGN